MYSTLTFNIYHLTFPIQYYMVTGGMNRFWKDIATTEILKKEGGTPWQKAASLPSARHAPKGITLPNGKFLVTGDGLCSTLMHGLSCIIIITGGVDKKKKVLKDILEYDAEEDKWSKVGDLPHPRYHHAISLVPKETADSCV